MSDTIYDAALALIQQGISVIPISTGTKAPPMQHRGKDFRWGTYTTRMPDASELYDWFVEHPYQLAVVCGPVSNNLVVLDFDSTLYPDGGYEQHAQQYPDIRNLPRVRTGSGKTHVYLRSDDVASRYTVGKPGDRVEVRAGNHYCVTAPSVHPITGAMYEWEQPGTPPTTTIAAVGFRPRTPSDTRRDPGVEGEPLSPEDTDRIIEFMSPFWKEGQRHDLSLAICGVLANCGVPESDTWMVLSALGHMDGREQLANYHHNLQTTYDRYRDGYSIAGWSSLTNNDLVDVHAAQQLEWLLAPRETNPIFNISPPQVRHPYIMPVSQLLSMQFPPKRYLVDGLLRAKTISMIVGPPKTWKTFVAQEIQLAVATGTPAFGMFTVSEPALTVYVQEESPIEDWQERYVELCAGRGIELDDIPHTLMTVSNPQPGLFFDNDQAWSRFIAEVMEPFLPELVIFDPFRNFHLGNENDSEAMVPILHRLKTLRDTYDCAILLVHHSNKSMDYTNPGDSIRGSSSIWGSMDGAIFVQNVKREKNDPDSMTFGASFDNIDSSVRKAQVVLKSGKEQVPEFFFALQQTDPGIVLHGFNRPEDQHSHRTDLLDWATAFNGWFTTKDMEDHFAGRYSPSQLATNRRALVDSRHLQERKAGRGNSKLWAVKGVQDDDPDF
jgi:hypothetical protein